MSAEGPQGSASSPEILGGLSLEQYAGLTAALAEGFPPADVLALEGIDAPAWAKAGAAWKAEIAKGGPEAPIFKAYCDKLAFAEDWLARPVDPLDADLEAWMGFLGAFSAHPSPFDLLQQGGLRMSDLARLQRRWAKRMSEDAQIRDKAAEIAKKQPKAAPSVRAGEAKLAPFPWSKGAPKPAPAEAATPALAPMDDEAFGLNEYAAVSAALALDPSSHARVLARHRLSADELVAIEERWKARLAADPALEQAFRHLYALNYARFQALARGAAAIDAERAASDEPAEAPIARPRPVFTGTSLTLAIPRGPVLPFAAGDAPPEIAKGSAEAAKEKRPSKGLGGTAPSLDIPRGPALPFNAADPQPPPKVADPPKLGGTALSVDVPRGPALPFAAPPAQPPKLAGTALGFDAPRGPALPFAAGDAPPEIVKSSPEAAKEKPASKGLGGTSLSVDVPRGPDLPFAKDATEAKKPNKLANLSLGLTLPRDLPLARTASAPASASDPSASWSPELTLEQHASLCVELAMHPDRSAETLVRYRLTPATKERLDQHYRAKVAASHETRAAWDRAYHAYYAWLRSQQGSRGPGG